MVFSSNIFLFAFLPIFLVTYYLTPWRAKSLLILVFSYFFYAWWRPDFLGLLVGVTLVSYAFALAIDTETNETKRLRLLTAGVTLNLLALAYFKYANFGVESFNAAVRALGFNGIEFAHVILPIGLSFYIFHAISYLVDIYRKEAPPARNLIDFAAFIALFPHLVAGPVLRYHLLAQQFRSRVHSISRFSRGRTCRYGWSYCGERRMSSPMRVPGPVSVRSRSSSAFSIWGSLRSVPYYRSALRVRRSITATC